MHKNVKLTYREIPGATFTHMTVFRHSEENTDRVNFMTLKGPLLYSFSLNYCQNFKFIQKKIVIKFM